MDDISHYRISKTTGAFMLGVALFYDVISFVPGLNIISAIFGVGTFALWFSLKGLGFVSPRRVATWGIGGMIEAIPALSALPGFTVGVGLMIAFSRLEDTTGISIPTATKLTRAQTQKGARRLAHPQRTREASARLERLRARQQERPTLVREKRGTSRRVPRTGLVDIREQRAA